MTEPLDLFGKPIQVGDYIAYPIRDSNSAAMNVYKVTGICKGHFGGTDTLETHLCETSRFRTDSMLKGYLQDSTKAINLGKCLDWYRPDEVRLSKGAKV